MSKTKQWIVTLSPDEPLHAVRCELEAVGFAVQEVLEAIGVVIGQTDEAGAQRVRDVKGVQAIEPEGAVDIGPPDRPTTW